MMSEKEGPSPVTTDTDVGDAEFEPTVDMLVHDFDDERTLEEAEAMEEKETQEEEVDNLNKEQDMPMNELLAMYGNYGQREDNGDVNNEVENNEEEPDTEGDMEIYPDETEAAAFRSSESEENINGNELDKDNKLEEIKPDRRKKKESSDLNQLYPELEANGDAISRSLRLADLNTLSTRKKIEKGFKITGSRQQSEEEDDEGEEASGEDEDDWRKTIMIGSQFQAVVPEGLSAYGDTPPYENYDTLLWENEVVAPELVENYLNTFRKKPKNAQGINALPLGSHVRDDEYALHLLLQCGYNVDEALRRHKMNPNKPVSQMTLWSEEECRNFENGLKTYGKDFHMIQQNKVRTRSVGELVQFYYLWKKTERHDMFANKTRIEKKKYIVHPGTTDYMDRFLDEGDPVSSLLYGKSGVSPPIPTSTIASATIALVSSVPTTPEVRPCSPVMRTCSNPPSPPVSVVTSALSPITVDTKVPMRGLKRTLSPDRPVKPTNLSFSVDSQSRHHQPETIAL